MVENNKTPKTPKTPKTKVEVKPSPELNPVLDCLKDAKNLAQDAMANFGDVIDHKLPKGTFTTKVQAALEKRIGRIGIVIDSVAKHLTKKSSTLGRRIASAATKEQRRIDRVKKAQERFEKAKVAIEKLQAKK